MCTSSRLGDGLEINPNDFDALYHKGVALARLGKHDEAVVCYDRMLEINPNDFEALYNKGVALGELKKK